MSIQTEIDRIISAVDAAHAKVAEKGGTTARPYLVANLANAIDTIPEAVDPKLQSKTATPTTSSQTIKPDSGYDGLSQVTVNAMPTATQATPSISVSSAGLITASATQTAGYVAKGTKSATKQLTVQAAQTITPGTSNKTIASGRYLTGTQTIKGDANLVAGNIKSGVSIFGVAGTFEGSGGGSGGGSEFLFEKATLTNMGMFEPGMDEYTVTSPNLNLSTRRMVGVVAETVGVNYSNFYSAFMIYRNNTSESFIAANGDDYGSGFSSSRTVINENSFNFYGSPVADDYYIVAM